MGRKTLRSIARSAAIGTCVVVATVGAGLFVADYMNRDSISSSVSRPKGGSVFGELLNIMRTSGKIDRSRSTPERLVYTFESDEYKATLVDQSPFGQIASPGDSIEGTVIETGEQFGFEAKTSLETGVLEVVAIGNPETNSNTAIGLKMNLYAQNKPTRRF